MVLGVMLLGHCIIKVGFNPQDDFDKLDYWILSCALLLLFAIVSSVFSFSSENAIKYYGQSVTSFLGVAILGAFSAFAFSGIALSDAGSFSWIYMVMSIIFIVFLTIVNLMRKIVEIAKKQEQKLRNEN